MPTFSRQGRRHIKTCYTICPGALHRRDKLIASMLVMDNTSRHTKQAEPLAAYWNATALPAMPAFLRELIGMARRQLHLSRIVVFGSRARTDCQPTSDYDLAFILDDSQGWAHFVADRQEEAGTLLPLDLVNFNEASESLRKEILATGITLYEK